ncbi:MAG: hypothetical protein KGQ58_06910 [Proteobacteria bacterium]|nr:hypothetical protein [Pseudomonadota bacterium]MDE3208694.1 hypothetical protein [Pseudomonadota bacterium]
MKQAQFAMAKQLARNAECLSRQGDSALQEQQWALLAECLERGEEAVLDEALHLARLMGGIEELMADLSFTAACHPVSNHPHRFVELAAIPVVCSLSSASASGLPGQMEDVEKLKQLLQDRGLLESDHGPVEVVLLPGFWGAQEILSWRYGKVYGLTRKLEAVLARKTPVGAILDLPRIESVGHPFSEEGVCVELRFFLGGISYPGEDDMPFEQEDRLEAVRSWQDALESYLNETYDGQYMVLDPGHFYGSLSDAVSNYQLFLLQYRINMGLTDSQVEPGTVSAYLSLHGRNPESIDLIRVAGYRGPDGERVFNGQWQIMPSDNPVQVIDLLTDMLVEEGIMDCHICSDVEPVPACRACGKPLFPARTGFRHMMRQKILQGTVLPG